MEYTLKISNLFFDDVNETFVYIRDALSNIDAANNLKNEIKDKLLLIKKIPNAGSILYSISKEETIFRYMRVKNYFIFYRVLNKEIYIHRFIYQGRDYMKVLKIGENDTP